MEKVVVSIDGKKRFEIEEKIRTELILAIINGMNVAIKNKEPEEVLFYSRKRATKIFEDVFGVLVK